MRFAKIFTVGDSQVVIYIGFDESMRLLHGTVITRVEKNGRPPHNVRGRVPFTSEIEAEKWLDGFNEYAANEYVEKVSSLIKSKGKGLIIPVKSK